MSSSSGTLPPRFKVEPPRMTILSDHPVDDSPDDLSLHDNLELSSRLSAIFDILRHKETKCPLTIAIYGDWGTGKTSAMKWLAAKLSEWNTMNNDRVGGHPNVHAIWFEPWKYHTREDVWRGIISEVILAMFRVNATDKEHLVNGLKEAARKFGAFLGRSFLHALGHTKFSFGPEQAGKFEISGEVFQDIHQEWERANHPQKPYLNQFEATLEDWVTRFLPKRDDDGVSRSDRMALFIDDLDRCLPEVTLEVLEAIKLYLSIKPLIFICGLDRTVVDAIVKKRYSDHGLADAHKSEHYLNKIFQVEVDVSPSETQIKDFLNITLSGVNRQTGGYLDEMFGEEESAPDPTSARERLHAGLTHLARHNPREIKRLLNSAILRGRMAADNIRLHDSSRTWIADNEAIIQTLKLPLEVTSLLFAQGVSTYLLQRHLESAHQLGRETTSYLFRTQKFLLWIQNLSLFLCSNPDFKPPTRTTEQKERLDSYTEIDNSYIEKSDLPEERLWYDALISSRPSQERGQTIPISHFENLFVFSILRIPFSAEVAQSSPTHGSSSIVSANKIIESLSPILRQAIMESLGKSDNENIDSKDIESIDELFLPAEASDEDLSSIHLLPKISYIDLDGTLITDSTLSQLIKLRNLSSVSAVGTQITDNGLEILSRHHDLENLYFSHTSISDQGATHLSKLKSLKTLDLSHSFVTDSCISYFSNLTNLTTLGLSYTSISDDSLRSISEIPSISSLQVRGTKITNNGLIYLSKMPNLTNLFLSKNQIDDKGLRDLSKLSEIATLAIGDTQITDDGIDSLSSLKNLSKLYLDNTSISDNAILALSDSHELQFISLRGTRITDEAVAHLLKIPKLATLDLRDTDVSQIGIRKLKINNPKLRLRK
ncbi:MAG: hypothetical protein KF712_08860 [Akkermansiaceae bacterium]|nr:hypothetical protein [Akkermansiaceae bacterium]